MLYKLYIIIIIIIIIINIQHLSSFIRLISVHKLSETSLRPAYRDFQISQYEATTSRVLNILDGKKVESNCFRPISKNRFSLSQKIMGSLMWVFTIYM